jgi:hypothetical protein
MDRSSFIRMLNTLIGVVMKTKSVAALLVASSVSLTAPAFAGGYGQTSLHHADAGAPVSQHGETAQTKAAAEGQDSAGDANHGGVGGDESVRSQSGRRAPADSIDPAYRGG